MKRTIWPFLVALGAVALFGCTTQTSYEQPDIGELARAIENLGPEVAPTEAQRAASIAYKYSLQLAQEYRITDPPVLHNAKVLNGLRDRGLCNHFVEDILKRMDQEDFRTLRFQWAASTPKPFQIAHYTAVVSQRKDSVYEGIVLDPWRNGGVLYWAPIAADQTYDWRSLSDAQQ